MRKPVVQNSQLISSIDSLTKSFENHYILLIERFLFTGKEMDVIENSNTVLKHEPVQINKIRECFHIVPSINANFKFPKSHNNSFFFILKSPSMQKGIRAYAFACGCNMYIIHSSDMIFETIPLSNNVYVKGRYVFLNEKRFSIKGSFDNSRNDLPFTDFVYSSFNNKSNYPYQFFFQSFSMFLTHPPLNASTFPIYSSVFCDPLFLFIFSCSAYTSKNMPDLINPWLVLIGNEFPRMYNLMAWCEFSQLNSKNLVMRGNNFFVSLTTYLIGSDPGFVGFSNHLSLDSPTIIEDFLTSFCELELTPLSRFLLHIVYKSGEIRFPNTDANRYGVSGVLFLRLLSPKLLMRGDRQVSSIKGLSQVYNLVVTDENQAHVNRLIEMIDKFKNPPPDFQYNPVEGSIQDSIHKLIEFITNNISIFLRIFEEDKYDKVIASYEQQEKDNTGFCFTFSEPIV